MPQPEIVFWNLEATLALFQPVLTRGVLPVFEDINRDNKSTTIFLVSKYFYLSTNRDFLRAFVGIEMEARGQPDNPVPDILGIPIDQVLDI